MGVVDPFEAGDSSASAGCSQPRGALGVNEPFGRDGSAAAGDDPFGVSDDEGCGAVSPLEVVDPFEAGDSSASAGCSQSRGALGVNEPFGRDGSAAAGDDPFGASINADCGAV